MSRSKHQTLKGIMDGQSQSQIDVMFSQRDHEAMEWVAKGKIKKEILRDRRVAKSAPKDESG